MNEKVVGSAPRENQEPALKLEALLDSFTFDPQSPIESELLQRALFVARSLQTRAKDLQSSQERRQQAELDQMIRNPHDKVTLTQMTDRAFRSNIPERSVEQLIHILDVQGIPRFFSPMERTLLRGFQSFGAYLPGVAAPLVKEKMQKETANVILPGELENLASHLDHRRSQGLRMNVNFLGEAILSEEEAKNRLRAYLQALQVEETEVMSVKISTLYSQISPLGREHTLSILSDRLEMLYRDAYKQKFERKNGEVVSKFIYLDMEEYRDLDLTCEVFMDTLSRPGLEKVQAGIVLQAYIPESFSYQQRLTEWALKRISSGGAPITIRIVKGANMEMERVEASIRGWPQAPFKQKIDTDANYKRMVEYALTAQNLNAVRVGIATHNLFEAAFAIALAHERKVMNFVQFEMLEGMANPQRRALFELTQNLLLYAPACKKEDFINAIGYLIRRLDENTGPENFLTHAFKVQVGSKEWRQLEESFVASFESQVEYPEAQPARRQQDRRREGYQSQLKSSDLKDFDNEPDTDFSLPHNVEWVENLLQEWELKFDSLETVQSGSFDRSLQIPLVVNGEEIFEGRGLSFSLDPSRPKACVAVFRKASSNDVERAIAAAHLDEDGWSSLQPEQRLAVFKRVAEHLREARGDLIGLAVAEGGKIITEADAEISEAIDFVEFYASSALEWYSRKKVKVSPRGIVAVISPWNFPIAIPCGGIASALAAGNRVILKPSSDTIALAYKVCECFWNAGVSRSTLQFLPCSGSREGQQLVTHDQVDTVILTGGTETALTLLNAKPNMRLLAETGGKNATVVTGLADRDQAIKNVLHSAFSHSGQKCSATSLLLLEREIFEDEDFKKSLCDAVKSLSVGSAWKLHTKMGPLIHPPRGDLEKGLKELEQGESWAVLPQHDEENLALWSPAVKWGVQSDSFTHTTELFGPVLGVMVFDHLDQAIERVNSTGFGLTSGLETLDDREQEIWKEGISAGNLYINRPTTGAIVLRQPFGGLGKSAFGPGIKAGGPNYVAQLLRFEDETTPSVSSSDEFIEDGFVRELFDSLISFEGSTEDFKRNIIRLRAAYLSYQDYYQKEFSKKHDSFLLVGQDNFRYYKPVTFLRIRVENGDTFFDVFARVLAAKLSGCRITISYSANTQIEFDALEILEELTLDWAAAVEFVVEDHHELARIVSERQTDRVRFSSSKSVPRVVQEAVQSTGVYLADQPVVSDGRVELLSYFIEQSLSYDYHRYGNLGERSEEKRRDVL